jgi:hypothetical protein
MDKALLELQKLCEGGIRFSVAPRDGGFLVQLGDFRDDPSARSFTKTLDEAAAWLREQAKHRYPESADAKALLTN